MRVTVARQEREQPDGASVAINGDVEGPDQRDCCTPGTRAVKRRERGDDFIAPMPCEARISVTVARCSQKLPNGASVATTYEAQGSTVIRMRMTVAQT